MKRRLIALGALLALLQAPAYAGGGESPAALLVEAPVPASLVSVERIAFGGVLAADTEPPAAVHLEWRSQSLGWLTTWSLQLTSDHPDWPAEGIVLSSVWPKAGHAYRARIDLDPSWHAMSVSVRDVTEGTSVFDGLVHLPQGDWRLAAPQELRRAGETVDRVVLASPVQEAVEPGLHGLPLELQKRFSFTVKVDPEVEQRQALLAGDSIRLALTWPDTFVPGEVVFYVETEDGRRLTAGVAAWSPVPSELPVAGLAEAGTGKHRLVAEYVFGPVRSFVAARELMVSEGAIAVEVRTLRVPGTYAVVDPGVDWSFHASDALEVTFHVSRRGRADGALRLEAWTESAWTAGASGTPFAAVTAALPAEDSGNVRFTLPLPAGEEPLRLVVRTDDAVIVTGQTVLRLQPTPVQWLPIADTVTRAIAALPEAAGVTHYTIYRATPEVGTFSHHAQIFYHGGVFYASWSNHATDEDAPGQRILYAVSFDGEHWSEVRELFPPNDRTGRSGQDGFYLTAQRHGYRTGFVAVDGKVYAICSVIVWESGSRRKVGELAREVEPGGALGPIFWLISDPPQPQPGFPAYPSAADPAYRSLAAKIAAAAGPITWSHYALRAADGHGIVELSSYVRPDGTGVLLGRDADGSRYMYAALGDPQARRWDPLVRVPIPDSPSLADTGVLPDGRVYLIHNPGPARDPLVISVSEDGRVFDRAWIIRAGAPQLAYQGMWKTRGYQYPSSVVAADALWVIYSDAKENVHVSRIPLASLR